MKYLINPFERIAGWQALLIGGGAMALTAVFGKINHVAFDGVLNVHAADMPFSFAASFAMQAVNFLSLFLTMWIAGVCFSKAKFRALDVAGTMALAYIPMLLLAVICFLPIVPVGLHDFSRMFIFGAIVIPFIIWTVALMYNAYTVSCHLKGVKAVVSFIGALLIASVISKVVVIFMLSNLFSGNPTSTFETNSSENTAIVADSLTIRQKTENVIKAFEQGNFNAITVYFDATMKERLTPNMMRMAWVQAGATGGRFEKADIEGLTETRINDFDIIEVPLIFRRENLKLRLAFNRDGEISGLFILPMN